MDRLGDFGVVRLRVLAADRHPLVTLGQAKPIAATMDPFGANFPAGTEGKWTVDAGGDASLSVTVPWLAGERVIGYLELARDTSGIADNIRRAIGSNLLLLLHKDMFDPDAWREGEKARGRNDGWDQLSHSVAVVQTLKSLPTSLALYLEENGPPRKVVVNGESGRRTLRATRIAVNDPDGNQLGDLVVLRDVTASTDATSDIIMITLAVGLVFAVALFFLMTATFDEIDRRQRKSRELAARIAEMDRRPSASGPVDLNEVARKLADEAGSAAPVLSLADGAAVVDADPALLQEALEQLLNNARHAAPDAPATVTVTREGRGGEPGWSIAIEDDGPGAPRAMTDDITTFLADREGRGLGNGLPLVGHIAARLGGRIDVVNRPRTGARISLWLPDSRQGGPAGRGAREMA